MIRRYFIAGLLVWVPLLVTLFIIRFIVNLIDNSLSFLPVAYQPDQWFGAHLPGVGLVVALLVLFFTGVVATNFFGRRLVTLWEKFLDKIPLVRTIYNAVKQVMSSLFNPSAEAFRKVLLIEYPRAGCWTIAFQTNANFKAGSSLSNADLVTVFVPTTPNPTSGFMLLIPKKDVIELAMGVDQALKMVISLGVMPPAEDKGQQIESN